MAIEREDSRYGEVQRPPRRVLNFWTDTATAVLFCALLGTGALMKFILPPGTCDAPALKLWLGHARHWWGDIHFWIAMTLLALMILHVYLHWNWVLAVWGKLVGSLRSPKTWALAGGMAALIAIPFVIPSQIIEMPPVAAAATADPAATPLEPCGIPGLTCETCPAAGDRLFTADEKAAKDGAAASAAAAEANCPTQDILADLEKKEKEKEQGKTPDAESGQGGTKQPPAAGV